MCFDRTRQGGDRGTEIPLNPSTQFQQEGASGCCACPAQPGHTAQGCALPQVPLSPSADPSPHHRTSQPCQAFPQGCTAPDLLAWDLSHEITFHRSALTPKAIWLYIAVLLVPPSCPVGMLAVHPPVCLIYHLTNAKGFFSSNVKNGHL